MASGNPAVRPEAYRQAGMALDSAQTMTLGGTVLKIGALLILALLAAGYTWSLTLRGPAAPQGALVLALVGGLLVGSVTGLATIFVPRIAPFTAPLYAVAEGAVLGCISAFTETAYPGVAQQALVGTFGILAMLLLLYGTRAIRCSERFKAGVIAATGGVCLIYVADLLLRFFGMSVPFVHETGTVGILFTLAVVVIAAMNLVLDFSFIEEGVRYGAPKYMEWYGAFTLMMTLVWLYLEVLRLLSKLQQRN